MLLEFNVSNFRSIRDKQSFSMLASERIKEYPQNVLKSDDYNITGTSIIYGRNGSGKSNLLKAIVSLQHLVVYSHLYNSEQIISQYQPYKLAKAYENNPVEFSIEFIAKNNIRFLYEVNISKTAILKENLYFFPKGQKAKLYERSFGEKIIFGDYLKGPKKDIEERLYQNQLYLSKIQSEKLEVLQPALKFFTDDMFASVMDKIDDDLITHHIKGQFIKNKRPKFRENILKLLKFADIGISAINTQEIDLDKLNLPEDLPEEIKDRIKADLQFRISTKHDLYDDTERKGEISFDLTEESLGTQKLFGVGGCIIEALMDGQLLIIDEFDKSLHPNLTKAIIKLFNSEKSNPFRAQLLIATHDVSLLDNNLFRRDQVWFAEKEFEGNSYYYSLSDIKGVRADVPFEQWYLKGKFGATPVFDDLELEFDLIDG